VDKETILNALKQVKYPGYSRDIVSFGLVREVSVHASGVALALELSTSDPALAECLRADVVSALELIGCAGVSVDITVKAPPRPNQGTMSAPKPIAGVRHVVAVASGKGGVGKSTFAVNLACALARELAGHGHVGLLDCDIYGPSIPLMLGLHQNPEVEGEQLLPLEKFGLRLMSLGFFLEEDSPVIWRGPMVMKTVQQFTAQVAWGELEILVVDLPPGTGDAPLSLVQTVAVDGAVIVTTPQMAAVTVARRGAMLFERSGVPLLGVAENMSSTEGARGVFGGGGGEMLAGVLNAPLLGKVPLDASVCEAGDAGVPIVISQPASAPGLVFAQIACQLLAMFSSKGKA
jgi:ATP-binding protein involved in chromosome partitioning